jgi:tetratricopeptide (TPR) repeat protein
VIALFALGLMSKPMLVTLPIVLLLLDYWPLGRLQIASKKSKKKQTWPGWSLVVEKIPLFGLAAIAGAITYYVQHKGGAGVTLAQIPLAMRFENAALSYVRYIHEMVWPSGLTVFYPYELHPPAVWKPLLALVFLAGVSAYVIRAARSRPYLAVGWLWYLGTLVPVIGIIQVGEQSLADRYTYIPLIGLFMVLAFALADLLSPFSRCHLLYAGISLALVIPCAVVTRMQLPYWNNTIALFQHALSITADNSVARGNLGTAYRDQGQFDQAMDHYQRAVDLNPYTRLSQNELGILLAERGRLVEAIGHFQAVLRLNPLDPDAYGNLCRAYSQLLGQPVPLRIGDPAGHNDLGAYLLVKKYVDLAIGEFRQSLRLRPDFPDPMSNLALAIINHPDPKRRDVRQALYLASRACDLSNRRDPLMLATLASAYALAGRLPDAISTAQEAQDRKSVV